MAAVNCLQEFYHQKIKVMEKNENLPAWEPGFAASLKIHPVLAPRCNQYRRDGDDSDHDDGDDIDHDDSDHDDSDHDIYIMMKCVSVCLSQKMITSSWESPVTTCNHP